LKNIINRVNETLKNQNIISGDWLMEIALDVSYTDFPVLGSSIGIKDVQTWQAETWGERGLETVMDTALAFGAKTINFRVYAPGPMWPSKVPGTWPNNWGEYTQRLGLKPDMAEWNMVKAAVDAAHRKGLKILGWFDLTEGHGGLPTAWSMNHPEFCSVNREGIRLDGPVGLIGKSGRRFDPTMVWMDYDELIAEGYMNKQCLRPDGVQCDPQLSLAFPEVVEYRLALLNEMFDFGLDGLFLVTVSNVGYEKPVSDSFMQKYGLDPRQVALDDPRWVKHQGTYFTSFIRKIRQLMQEKERVVGRKLEFVLEGQGGIPRPWYQDPEIGWERLPTWASMPAFVDIETLAREKLIDTVALWTFREMDALNPEVRKNVKLATRYRYMDAEQFTPATYKARVSEAEKRDVSLFLINEARVPLSLCPWMYPGKPGSLYELTQKLKTP
jgi:hypothetical protein